MTALAAVEMVARIGAAVGLALYLWDRRRREIALCSLKATAARQQRALHERAVRAGELAATATAFSAAMEARVRERSVRAGEMQAAAGALTATLETRRHRVPRPRQARAVGFER